jgi:hypothetical protein
MIVLWRNPKRSLLFPRTFHTCTPHGLTLFPTALFARAVTFSGLCGTFPHTPRQKEAGKDTRGETLDIVTREPAELC